MRRAATEHEIQAAIVDALRLAGFTVRETTAYRQKGASGVDKGIADLLVFHQAVSNYHFGVCLCIEVKRPGPIKWSSPEQQQAYEQNEILVAQSVEEALLYCHDWIYEVCVAPFLGLSPLNEQCVRAVEKIRSVIDATKKAGA